MLETFADRLQFALVNAGLTPGQLDRVMGWNKGETRELLRYPSPQALGENEGSSPFFRGLTEKLGVSASWLFEGKPTERARAAAAEMQIMAAGKMKPSDVEKMVRIWETLE